MFEIIIIKKKTLYVMCMYAFFNLIDYLELSLEKKNSKAHQCTITHRSAFNFH